jgi:hypothetical protein
MSNKTMNNPTRKPLARMTAAELADATKGAENIDFEDTKPLPPAMAAAWDRAKRGRGRPRIGEGAEKVLISIEKRLLLVTDALARRKGLDRSKLIARAIREMLEREASEKGHPTAGAVTGSFKAAKRSAGRSPRRKKVQVAMAGPFRESQRPE